MGIKQKLIEAIEHCSDDKKLSLLYQYAAGLLQYRPEKPKKQKNVIK